MFRSRLPGRALFTSAATATIALHDPSQEQDKLSIYPAQEPEILLLDTPLPLEKQIGVARKTITKSLYDAHARVHGVVSKWIAVEHAVENRVKSIISPTESLTPGLLYVGISTLSGSILARSRILPTRLLVPPTFFFISLNYFLPKTTANLSSYISSLEELYFPSFAQKHAVANAHTRMTWERFKASSEQGRSRLRLGAERTVEKVQDVTGLKLKETFGWSRAAIQNGESKVSEIAKAIEKNENDIGGSVEKVEEAAGKKVEEVKRLV